MSSRFGVALIALSASALLGAAPSKPDMAGAATFTVALSGQEEVARTRKWAGDLDGSGLVRLTVDPASREICYDFQLSNLSMPLMAHIHRGPEFGIGPSVVTLFTGPGGELHDCVPWTEKRLAEIVARPSDFYVNLYTTEFPDGALRGQLAG